MHPNLLKGAALIMLSECFFVLMGTQIRSVSEGLNNEMIVFFRNVFGLQVIIPLLYQHGVQALKTTRPMAHIFRGIAGISAMYCFYYSLANIPLANAMILKMTAPLFIPLIAWLWLKEPLSKLIGPVILLGFIGVTFIIKPDMAQMNSVALVGLAGGFLAAIAKTTVKNLTSTEKPVTIVFYFALCGLVITSLPAFLNWQTPSPTQLFQLLLLGLSAVVAQIIMTRAYFLAPASQISHYSYSSILYASLAGWLLWDEWMDLWSWLGTALIITSGVMLIRVRRKI
jgi:drug/metabolite transporter (DMT)-like permease